MARNGPGGFAGLLVFFGEGDTAGTIEARTAAAAARRNFGERACVAPVQTWAEMGKLTGGGVGGEELYEAVSDNGGGG